MNGATPASDIWSLGCTIIELLTGSPPHFDLAPLSAMFRIVQDDQPALPQGLSPALDDFLTSCFQKDYNLRVSAEKLRRHPWLSRRNQSAPAAAVAATVPIPAAVAAATPGSARDVAQAVVQYNEAFENHARAPSVPASPTLAAAAAAAAETGEAASGLRKPMATSGARGPAGGGLSRAPSQRSRPEKSMADHLSSLTVHDDPDDGSLDWGTDSDDSFGGSSSSSSTFSLASGDTVRLGPGAVGRNVPSAGAANKAATPTGRGPAGAGGATASGGDPLAALNLADMVDDLSFRSDSDDQAALDNGLTFSSPMLSSTIVRRIGQQAEPAMPAAAARGAGNALDQFAESDDDDNWGSDFASDLVVQPGKPVRPSAAAQAYSPPTPQPVGSGAAGGASGPGRPPSPGLASRNAKRASVAWPSDDEEDEDINFDDLDGTDSLFVRRDIPHLKVITAGASPKAGARAGSASGTSSGAAASGAAAIEATLGRFQETEVDDDDFDDFIGATVRFSRPPAISQHAPGDDSTIDRFASVSFDDPSTPLVLSLPGHRGAGGAGFGAGDDFDDDDEEDIFANLDDEFEEEVLDEEKQLARDRQARLLNDCARVLSQLQNACFGSHDNMFPDEAAARAAGPENTIQQACEAMLDLLQRNPDIRQSFFTEHRSITVMDFLSAPPSDLQAIPHLLRVINEILTDNEPLLDALCLMGGIPAYLALADFSNAATHAIRLQVARFVRLVCFRSTGLSQQTFISCRGTAALVQMLDWPKYGAPSALLARERVLLVLDCIKYMMDHTGSHGVSAPRPQDGTMSINKNQLSRVFGSQGLIQSLVALLPAMRQENAAASERQLLLDAGVTLDDEQPDADLLAAVATRLPQYYELVLDLLTTLIQLRDAMIASTVSSASAFQSNTAALTTLDSAGLRQLLEQAKRAGNAPVLLVLLGELNAHCDYIQAQEPGSPGNAGLGPLATDGHGTGAAAATGTNAHYAAVCAALLKCVKMVRTLADINVQDALERAGAIATLVRVLDLYPTEYEAVVSQRGPSNYVSEIRHQAMAALFGLCRLSRARQAAAAEAGIIPHLTSCLQARLARASAIRNLALAVLVVLPLAGAATRDMLWKEDALAVLLELAAGSTSAGAAVGAARGQTAVAQVHRDLDYTQMAALEAISDWLSEDTERVELVLSEEEHIACLVAIMCTRVTANSLLERLLDRFERVVMLAAGVRRSLALSPAFLRGLARKAFQPGRTFVPKAQVRVSVMKILTSLASATLPLVARGELAPTAGVHGFIQRDAEMLSIIQHLAQHDKSVLVKRMALDILNPPQPGEDSEDDTHPGLGPEGGEEDPHDVGNSAFDRDAGHSSSFGSSDGDAFSDSGDDEGGTASGPAGRANFGATIVFNRPPLKDMLAGSGGVAAGAGASSPAFMGAPLASGSNNHTNSSSSSRSSSNSNSFESDGQQTRNTAAIFGSTVNFNRPRFPGLAPSGGGPSSPAGRLAAAPVMPSITDASSLVHTDSDASDQSDDDFLVARMSTVVMTHSPIRPPGGGPGPRPRPLPSDGSTADEEDDAEDNPFSSSDDEGAASMDTGAAGRPAGFDSTVVLTKPLSQLLRAESRTPTTRRSPLSLGPAGTSPGADSGSDNLPTPSGSDSEDGLPSGAGAPGFASTVVLTKPISQLRIDLESPPARRSPLGLGAAGAPPVADNDNSSDAASPSDGDSGDDLSPEAGGPGCTSTVVLSQPISQLMQQQQQQQVAAPAPTPASPPSNSGSPLASPGSGSGSNSGSSSPRGGAGRGKRHPGGPRAKRSPRKR
ncbi:hypothetical protein H696_02197 [Fonticula alba]|uniref:Protein kinase domain-containing protein n=1 Tax=Fonticula alba TaxID=691883 RepID=A0A058ZCT3_FONAL|nr:hypothetical protein H696_02197 [Fonticula alba]KCV71247.1 hypothetical protein H696_02197 [Fonticula alba]|eukprot:XP_009494370.1 hypothetical protein H696_02197 [Fonticula alba]